MSKTPIKIKEDVDYLVSKINIGASYFDAKAISIMNTYGNDLLSLSVSIDKVCSTCKHFGNFTLHPCDGGMIGCKKLNIEDSDRKLGGCIANWEQK